MSIKAKDDLKKIVLYIRNELKEPSIENKYTMLMKREIQKLEYFSQKFAIVDDDIIKDLNFRKTNINNYIVFYRIEEEVKRVNIARILYGALDWLSKL